MRSTPDIFKSAVKGWMKLKCSKCVHFYRTVVGPDGKGYNPAPYCHRFKGEGKRPDVLGQGCYKPRRSKRGKGKVES